MISDSEGDDFEDASEFGVDDSEMFGMGSSSCRKSPMSTYTALNYRCYIILTAVPVTVLNVTLY